MTSGLPLPFLRAGPRTSQGCPSRSSRRRPRRRGRTSPRLQAVVLEDIDIVAVLALVVVCCLEEVDLEGVRVTLQLRKRHACHPPHLLGGVRLLQASDCPGLPVPDHARSSSTAQLHYQAAFHRFVQNLRLAHVADGLRLGNARDSARRLLHDLGNDLSRGVGASAFAEPSSANPKEIVGVLWGMAFPPMNDAL